MFANDVPVRIATSFFRTDLFADTRMAEPDFVRPSLQLAIEDLGYTFGRAEESLILRRPTLFERDTTLELEPDEWIVHVLRTSYSTEGTPSTRWKRSAQPPRHIFPIGQVVAWTDEF
jgi:GntR family transcriptional regulator